ncbi:MAG: hypothetical protein KDC98_21435 [Planctomycetes bacterium]|nr:hypothetical protein [Planctomycetota bacterium]
MPWPGPVRVISIIAVARPVIEPATELSAAEKLRLSLQMFAYGCDMMRQNLRRTNPALDDAAIEERLRAWLRVRPGAESGDGVGRAVAWPRSRGAGNG